MSNPVIKVENLSKSYRLGQIGTSTLSHDLQEWWQKQKNRRAADRMKPLQNANEIIWALQDINFEVQQGETLGIIGRNGAGKSTLLKILSRITGPTQGIVKVKGKIASLLEVGTGFHPELTGRENIFLNGAILGMSQNEVRKKFDEIVAFAEIEQFVDTPVKRYSSGMYVRLAFAVAAHLDADILLVDEVLAVGDANFQKKCLGKMGDVAHSGRTILFVSHNMAAVKTLCTRGILLRAGNLALASDVAKVIFEYHNAAVEFDESNQTRLVEFGDIQINQRRHGNINLGEPIEIAFKVKLQSAVHGIKLICLLNDGEGNTAFHLSTNEQTLQGLNHPGEHKIKLSIPNLWLRPGIYSLTIKAILQTLGKKQGRFVADPVMVDIDGDISGEALYGILTPEAEWQLA